MGKLYYFLFFSIKFCAQRPHFYGALGEVIDRQPDSWTRTPTLLFLFFLCEWKKSAYSKNCMFIPFSLIRGWLAFILGKFSGLWCYFCHEGWKAQVLKSKQILGRKLPEKGEYCIKLYAECQQNKSIFTSFDFYMS